MQQEYANKILQGDSLEILKTLPSDLVDCVVTSPPYWGLRDYGVAGQLGLEKTPQEYISRMVTLFKEVKRVMKPCATLWLNMGDSFAGSGKGENPNGKQGTNKGTRFESPTSGAVPNGLKPKDLIGVPWRLAFALQEDGWYLRSDIIWAKPNPMPESVRDRPTRAHEYIFLMSKSPKYFYDSEAIKTPAKESSIQRLNQENFWNQTGGPKDPLNGNRSHRKVLENINKQRGHSRRHDGFNDRWDKMEKGQQQINGANKRDVWTVATHPFKEAHFATFPPKLIEPCILAGCPKDGLVLDPFFGAGTTGLVARQHGRNFLGIELNPAYIEIAKKRLWGECSLLAPTGE